MRSKITTSIKYETKEKYTKKAKCYLPEVYYLFHIKKNLNKIKKGRNHYNQ